MRAILIAMMLTGLVGCGQVGNSPPAAVKKTYERGELEKMLKGKTEAEVIELIGKPDRTQKSGANSTWIYDGISKDNVTGKVDSKVLVEIEAGKVDRIHF